MNDLDKLIQHHEGSDYFEPEAEREEPLKCRGLIIVAGAILLWAIFIGIAIEAVQAWGAVFG